MCTAAHLELARDGIRQSVVLAKNAGGVLPLSAAAFKAPVVIGPLASVVGEGTTTYYGSTPCVNQSAGSALLAIAEVRACGGRDAAAAVDTLLLLLRRRQQ